MHSLRSRRRPATWFAALAILVAALLPSLSQALGASTAASWIEVCTAQGSRWLQAEAGDTGGDIEGAPDASALHEHCAICQGQSPAPGLPPGPSTPAPLLALDHARPTAVAGIAPRPSGWRWAPPRAPPAHA